MAPKKIVLRVRVFDMVFYALISIAAHYVINLTAYWLPSRMMGGVLHVFPEIPAWLFNIATYLILLPPSILGPIALFCLWFKYIIPRHYQPSDDARLWIKNALYTLLPGELARFLFCAVKCGYMNFAALPTTLFFDRWWLDMTDRYQSVRQMSDFIFLDYVGYTLCYVIFFAGYAAILLWTYRKYWIKAEIARKDLDISESHKLY